jgi:hypothetical protein
MTQRSLNRAVAEITGESAATIACLGFCPLTRGPVEREPLTVDWEDMDASRYRILPQRQRSRAGSE